MLSTEHTLAYNSRAAAVRGHIHLRLAAIWCESLGTDVRGGACGQFTGIDDDTEHDGSCPGDG